MRASNLFYGYSACAYIAAKVKSGYVVENEGTSSPPTARTARQLQRLHGEARPEVHVLQRPPSGTRTRRHRRLQRRPSMLITAKSKASTTSTAAPDPGISSSSHAKGYGPIGGKKPHVILGSMTALPTSSATSADGWMDAVNVAAGQPVRRGRGRVRRRRGDGCRPQGRGARFDQRSVWATSATKETSNWPTRSSPPSSPRRR